MTCTDFHATTLPFGRQSDLFKSNSSYCNPVGEHPPCTRGIIATTASKAALSAITLLNAGMAASPTVMSCCNHSCRTAAPVRRSLHNIACAPQRSNRRSGSRRHSECCSTAEADRCSSSWETQPTTSVTLDNEAVSPVYPTGKCKLHQNPLSAGITGVVPPPLPPPQIPQQ